MMAGVALLGQVALGGVAWAQAQPEQLSIGEAGVALAAVVQAPSQPRLSIDGEPLPLLDDGVGVDAVAGDGVYSGELAQWPSAQCRVVLGLGEDTHFDDLVVLAPSAPRVRAILQPGQVASVRFEGQLPRAGEDRPKAQSGAPLSSGALWGALLGAMGLAGGLWLGLSFRVPR